MAETYSYDNLPRHKTLYLGPSPEPVMFEYVWVNHKPQGVPIEFKPGITYDAICLPDSYPTHPAFLEKHGFKFISESRNPNTRNKLHLYFRDADPIEDIPDNK